MIIIFTPELFKLSHTFLMVLFFIVYLTRNCLKQRYYDHRELLRKRWCPWATPGRSSRKKPPSRPAASRRRDGECSSRLSSVVVRLLGATVSMRLEVKRNPPPGRSAFLKPSA
jgi:hypothetical protein